MRYRIVKRRDFITLVSSAALTWPLAARAQQRATPLVGYLSGGAPRPPFTTFLAAFRQGLGETGYEGQNVAIEYRWAEGHYDRLPALAADLANHKVNLIAASGGDLAARAAKTQPQRYRSSSPAVTTQPRRAWLPASRVRAETSRASASWS
jgi:putative tryptophan/tyrosine transport system substrate-binding protein